MKRTFEEYLPEEKVLVYAAQSYGLTVLCGLIGESAPEFPECLEGECDERALEAWRFHVGVLMHLCEPHKEQIGEILRLIKAARIPIL